MATVGKKKYKKIYVRRGRSKVMLPLLLVGGGLAFYFLVLKKGPSVADITPTPDQIPPPGGTTSDSNPRIVDSGAGTGTQVIQPKPLESAPGENMAAVNTVAAGNRGVLLRDAADYPEIIRAIKQMSSQEILDTYQYFYGWFLKGQQLFRYPDPRYPSMWNTQLYDAIQVIRAKYHIF